MVAREDARGEVEGPARGALTVAPCPLAHHPAMPRTITSSARRAPAREVAALAALALLAALSTTSAAAQQGTTTASSTATRAKPSSPVRRPARVVAAPEGMPALAREFRAVWVASVSNIDWPSRPGLSTQEQQQELIALMDRAAALNLNAVIFQVRPAADALYASALEPWSEYLTGVQGEAPKPFWDPLAFAVAEAHARGLELHAWFNPYRARQSGARSAPAASHVSVRRPELVKTYGPYLWMDPGEPAVREQSLRVVMDVVRRYDVDGIHIDDYFYPYKVRDTARGGNLEFPDEPSWQRYRQGGGKLSRDDWRRRNVDLFVETAYRQIKQAKPWVKFGISPFGIWRPGYPESVRGLDAYTELYADSRKWVREGWLDYNTPQLYWPVDRPQQGYVALMRWWAQQNVKGRHLWPGNFTSRVGGAGESGWRLGELLEQIRLTRADSSATGNVHFSARALMRNPEGLSDVLETITYATPALVPASPWLDRTAPVAPAVAVRPDSTRGGATLTLTPASQASPFLWAVRARYGEEWRTEIVPGAVRRHHLAPLGLTDRPDVIVVNAIDRVGNASPDRVVGGGE